MGLKIRRKKIQRRTIEQQINKEGLVIGFRFKGEKKFVRFDKFRKNSKFKQPKKN